MMLPSRARILMFCCAALTVTAAMFAQPCRGQVVGSGTLVSGAREFDGKEVVVEGEVIGDIMVRGAYAWVSVLDAGVAIGVWVPVAQTRDIVSTGSYGSQGDRVRVVGVFHRVCPEHGGDMDIHAQACTKVASGAVRGRAVDQEKRKLALRLSGIVVLLWIFSQLKIR